MSGRALELFEKVFPYLPEDLGPGPKLLLQRLARHQGFRCCSQEELGREVGVDARSIRRFLGELESWRLINLAGRHQHYIGEWDIEDQLEEIIKDPIAWFYPGQIVRGKSGPKADKLSGVTKSPRTKTTAKADKLSDHTICTKDHKYIGNQLQGGGGGANGQSEQQLINSFPNPKTQDQIPPHPPPVVSPSPPQALRFQSARCVISASIPILVAHQWL